MQELRSSCQVSLLGGEDGQSCFSCQVTKKSSYRELILHSAQRCVHACDNAVRCCRLGSRRLCSGFDLAWAICPSRPDPQLDNLQLSCRSQQLAIDQGLEMAEVGMPHHLQPLHPIQPQHLPPMDPPLCTCGDLATFAMTGSCRPTHCMAHREPGMMEVKKCVCGKARPSYALPGVSEATHCAR